MKRSAFLGVTMLAIAATLPASSAPAHEFAVGSLLIIHPTARPNLPDRPMAAYVTIANDGDAPDRLLAATAPGFEAVELHESKMQGTVMTMEHVTAIEISPHDTVVLEPGGLHIMLFGATHQFKPGESFPMVLRFEAAGEVRVDVLVEKPADGEAGGMTTDHSHAGHGQAGHGTGQSGN